MYIIKKVNHESDWLFCEKIPPPQKKKNISRSLTAYVFH